MEALTERAAALPKIDLVRAALGDRQDDRRRDPLGVVYGFAGLVDGIVRRLRAELGGDAPRSPRAASPARSSRTRTRSTRSTTCSRSPGCGSCTSATAERRYDREPCALPATTAGRSAASRSPTASCSRRSPGSATGSCACRPSATAPAWPSREMVSSFAIHHGNERTCTRAAAHPPRRAAPGRDPALRPGPRRDARGGRAGRRAPRRRPDRPQHGLPGAEGLQDRRRRGAARRSRPRGRRREGRRARAAACR